MRKSFLILIASAAIAAEPSSPRLSTPVLGYVFDASSKSVRPISGVPGAASVEGPLPSATKLDIGFVSQNRRHLLAGTLEGIVLIDLTTNASVELEGAPSDMALGSWSSDSRSFALWTRSGALQVWTGFPDSPALEFSTAVESAAGVAIADGGHLASFWNEAGLSFVDAERTGQVLSGHVTAAAFKPGTTEWAAVVDSHLARSNAEPAEIDVPNPSAIAFSGNGVLIAGEKALAIIGANGSRVIGCDCTAKGVDRLAGRDVFRLIDPDARSIAIYDGDSDEPRIVYIPTEGGRQ
jgi:hypothetical protein